MATPPRTSRRLRGPAAALRAEGRACWAAPGAVFPEALAARLADLEGEKSDEPRPFPARPARPPRPPEARAGEHRPTCSALHPAGARPGRLCSPGTPRPACGSRNVSRPPRPTQLVPPSQGHTPSRGVFRFLSHSGRVSGMPAPRPSFLQSRPAQSLRVRIAESPPRPPRK